MTDDCCLSAVSTLACRAALVVHSGNLASYLSSKFHLARNGGHSPFKCCMLKHLSREVHLQISCIQASMVLLSPAGF